MQADGVHGSREGGCTPFAIVAEGPVVLDAPLAGRFAWPLALRARARKRPVWDCVLRATCSGVPVAMIFPPWSPPSGPKSINQSADLMTSRLCSMTASGAPDSRGLG